MILMILKKLVNLFVHLYIFRRSNDTKNGWIGYEKINGTFKEKVTHKVPVRIMIQIIANVRDDLN